MTIYAREHGILASPIVRFSPLVSYASSRASLWLRPIGEDNIRDCVERLRYVLGVVFVIE